MADFKLELNSEAIQDLLKSDGVIGELQRQANAIQQRCGKGYVVSDPYIGETRANVSVRTNTKEAREDNLKNNTLLKAIK